ncbi:DUF1904 family protein [Brevibacillus fortis]|uniref:DUF1904 domain-containing protein n=1 Tax=Brevibacillus fortis TaxID=2126352 RepID=A0A2P7VBU9_9BACL|nr:DUF1904 family protein [Brevibacillus fortis]MED1785283.1 DUF1904 family protein [Brevibacillus fortis]PSJ96697.1 DUF1904 domain-containing protein [Brevibacillus fortis]
MPFLRFKGFAKQDIEPISQILIEEFSKIAEVAQEKVKLELLSVEQLTNSPLSVEIMMFPREPKQHDAIASAIHGILKKQGFLHVHIFFILLSPTLYYKEGLPLQVGMTK